MHLGAFFVYASSARSPQETYTVTVEASPVFLTVINMERDDQSLSTFNNQPTPLGGSTDNITIESIDQIESQQYLKVFDEFRTLAARATRKRVTHEPNGVSIQFLKYSKVV